MASESRLPPPPAQLTAAWLLANLDVLKSYMDVVYALQDATVVVDGKAITGAVKIVGSSATISFGSGLKLQAAIPDPSTNTSSLQSAIATLFAAMRNTTQLPR